MEKLKLFRKELKLLNEKLTVDGWGGEMERDKSNRIDINGFSRCIVPWKILLVTSLDRIILQIYKFSFRKQNRLFKIDIYHGTILKKTTLLYV